jgi:hypothetical protein
VIKLVGISQFPPCKKTGDLGGWMLQISNKVTKLLHHPPFFENQALQLIYHLFERVPVQRNIFSMCLFLECFSEVKYITFLPEQTGQLLLYLWRIDINSTKKGAINSCEKKTDEFYFGCKVGRQEKVWVPKICCFSCSKARGLAFS